MLDKVDGTETGSFCTDERTAPAETFAGKNAVESIGKTFVLTEKITDFTGTDTDITGGNVSIR